MCHLEPRRPIDPALRIPPAGQVIDSPLEALGIITYLASAPLTWQTIVITLDDERAGWGLTTVHGPDDPDGMLDALDRVLDTAHREVGPGAVIIGSIRPDGAVDIDDGLRWREADERCTSMGLELLEWFVLGPATMVCPRELVGDLARWAS